MENFLPPIPAKRYFTISEVGNLCGVKPHVLRYWEQEFTQLRPMKRRGNRRYYQHHEVLMIRKIRDLLYEQGFTIIGARSKLQDFVEIDSHKHLDDETPSMEWQLQEQEHKNSFLSSDSPSPDIFANNPPKSLEPLISSMAQPLIALVRQELMELRELLSPPI